jgi:hypothetical protein
VAGPPESSAGVRTVALPVMLVQVVGEHLESQRGPKGGRLPARVGSPDPYLAGSLASASAGAIRVPSQSNASTSWSSASKPLPKSLMPSTENPP